MIYEKEVRMVINQYNQEYYQQKMGRSFSIGERIVIPVDILPPTSGVRVTTKCEYCGKIYKVSYRRYLESLSKGKICCKNCREEKILENCIKKYGTRSTLNVPEVHQKMINTVTKKYGSEELFYQSNHIKSMKVIQQKYNTHSVLTLPEIREKSNQTMYAQGNNKVFTSAQQLYLCNLFHGVLNYPCGPYHLDVFLSNENIGIEYSGAGHDLSVRLGRVSEKYFNGKEKARHSYFYNHKIPIIEFISKTDKLPKDNILIKLFNEALEEIRKGKMYITIDLDRQPH